MRNLISSKKIDNLIKSELNKNLNADSIHESVCAKLGLYAVKYFGHGTKYQRIKVALIWNTILFFMVDFKEYSHLTNEVEKNQIKNYLKL